MAVDPQIPFWLICSYDAETLSAAVLEEAHRSHPVIVDARVLSRQRRLRRPPARSTRCSQLSLPQLAGQPAVAAFTAHTVSRLQNYIRLELHVAGLPDQTGASLAIATQQLALSSLRRGATEVTVRIWNEPHAMILEVADGSLVKDVLLGRRVPSDDQQDGLWHANQLCDLVQMRSSSTGTHVRVYAWK